MAWAMPQAMERLLATPTINARLPWRNPITSSLGFDAARGAAVGCATVLSPVKKSANSTENRPSREGARHVCACGGLWFFLLGCVFVVLDRHAGRDELPHTAPFIVSAHASANSSGIRGVKVQVTHSGTALE